MKLDSSNSNVYHENPLRTKMIYGNRCKKDLNRHSLVWILLACGLLSQTIFEAKAMADGHKHVLVVEPAFTSPTNDGTSSQFVNQSGSLVLYASNKNSTGDHAGFVIHAEDGDIPQGEITFRTSNSNGWDAYLAFAPDIHDVAIFDHHPVHFHLTSGETRLRMDPHFVQLNAYIADGLSGVSFWDFEFISVDGERVPMVLDTSHTVTKGSYASPAPPGY